jgi:transposase InsO family protein
MLACDFFTVETVMLRTVYVFFFNETHLMAVLREYSAYYNCRRPHQGLGQRIPMMPALSSNDKGPVRCRTVLGGVIRHYCPQAA